MNLGTNSVSLTEVHVQRTTIRPYAEQFLNPSNDHLIICVSCLIHYHQPICIIYQPFTICTWNNLLRNQRMAINQHHISSVQSVLDTSSDQPLLRNYPLPSPLYRRTIIHDLSGTIALQARTSPPLALGIFTDGLVNTTFTHPCMCISVVTTFIDNFIKGQARIHRLPMIPEHPENPE